MIHMVTESKLVRIDKKLISEVEKLAKEKQSTIPKQINWLVGRGLELCANGEQR